MAVGKGVVIAEKDDNQPGYRIKNLDAPHEYPLLSYHLLQWFVRLQNIFVLSYRKNLNTIRMILTKSRGSVEGLRIIQVN